ncbi:unnamed protein product [Cyprideis torosa]|uniref:Methyltransferase small domain-containing protein n=1 Tax=Cyprideis torosa TaxID=163714 RepID=A0A7R8ZYG3_9CRUS|nr:unnamed protein product [Cyprideis torosa]CAG0908325.1 unnamed protein product [Cyprideis torosa]
MSPKQDIDLQHNLAEAIDSLLSIKDCVRWGVSQFNRAGLYFGHGTDNAFDEAVWLVLHTLSMPLDLDVRFHDCRLTRSEREAVLSVLIERVTSRKPAAYLTGEGWFCGLPFTVNEHVLVPRSPIGEMIQEGFEPWLSGWEPSSILDLCTGSGCIGIACAYAFPDARVALSDISDEALEVARGNVARHELGERITVLKSDVFDQIPPQTFDLIVSNPPYVDAQDMADLPEEYRREPELALAAGADGLDIVRRMLTSAADYLSENGLMVVEVGNSELAMAEAFPDLNMMWPDFEQGGHGVFVVTAADLRRYLAG